MKIVVSKYYMQYNMQYINKNIKSIIVIYYKDFSFCFIQNNKIHNETGPAIVGDNSKQWFYKNAKYGFTNSFSNKSWKKFVKELKREERLKIFK